MKVHYEICEDGGVWFWRKLNAQGDQAKKSGNFKSREGCIQNLAESEVKRPRIGTGQFRPGRPGGS